VVRLKRLILIVVSSFTLFTASFSQLNSVEITDDFKKALKTIAQDEFKEFIYNKIKQSNPILASSTYDLIDNLVSGESLSLIQESLINTIIDYGTLQFFLDSLKPSMDEVRNQLLYREKANVISEEDYDKLLYLSTVYIFEGLAYKTVQPIGNHVTELLYSEEPFFNQIRMKGDTSDITSYVAPYIVDSWYRKVFDDAVVFKNVASKINALGKIDSTALFQLFAHIPKDYKSQLNRLSEITETYIVTIRSSIVSSKTKYGSIVDFCLPYFRNLVLRSDLHSNISEQLFVKNLAKNIEEHFVDLESSVSYEIGLGADYFFQGPLWLPDTSKYPVLSLRVNDRIQWSFASYDKWKFFVYGGGLIDFALKELSKSGQNEFLLFGIGLSYGNVSATISTGYPVNRPGEKRWGGVTGLTYDLPVSKMVSTLTK
jgi:hypothetical protein